jgi:hypothetical protein
LERRTNQWVLQKIGSDRMLRRSMAIRKMCLFGHIMRSGKMEKRIIEGSMNSGRRRGRPTISWIQDIKEWTGQGLAAADHQAANRQGWRALVLATAAQFRAN